MALVLGLATRTVYALPLEVTAELRAVSCCTQHTGQPSSVPDARRCCRIASNAGAGATMTAAPGVPAFHPHVALPATFPVVRDTPHAGFLDERNDAPRDGPPLYLGLLTIRR